MLLDIMFCKVFIKKKHFSKQSEIDFNNKLFIS